MRKHNVFISAILPSKNKLKKTVKLTVLGITAILIISMLSFLPGVSAQTTALPLHVEGNRIVNSLGQTVILRGVQKSNFADDPDGAFSGNTLWNENNVIKELDAMKSWGINTIRLQTAAEQWKYDQSTPNAALDHKAAIKRLAELAAERGIYLIYTGYKVTDSWRGGNQDPLPYPPYQTSVGASSVITSKQDFVSWWSSVASELKNYPNVLFEIWNEPTVNPFGFSTSTASSIEAEYFTVVQQVINAIRATGSQQLILTQWDWATWVDLDYPWGGGEGTMSWITTANLYDPTGNLVYTTHIYRQNGATGIYSIPTSIQQHGSNHAWEYDQIKLALQYEKINWVTNTLNKPLLITEIGCNIAQTGTALTQELTAYQNLLTILNEWGIGYIAHVWSSVTQYPLLTSDTTFAPTQTGTILKTALAYSQQQTSPSTSPPATTQPNTFNVGDQVKNIYAPTDIGTITSIGPNNWANVHWNSGANYGIAFANIALVKAAPTSTPTPAPATTQPNTFNVGDQVKNIYAPTDIGTITSIGPNNWANVHWNSGANYGIAFANIALVKAAPTSTPTPAPATTQPNTFNVGDQVKNIYAPTDIGTITSIGPNNWANVHWNSGANYGIAFANIALVKAAPTSTPTPAPATTQPNTFNVGDQVKNIYAPTDIGTITSIGPNNWANVHWNSGANYGIAFANIVHV